MIRWLAPVLLAAVLAGCETEGGLLITYGAQGTQIQAERLVAKIYGHPAKPLPYGSADIDQAFRRMQGRWSKLRVALDEGALGLTEDGLLALRTSGAPALALSPLLRAENRDRQLLYRAQGIVVGHGDAAELSWLAYTEDTFAKEWLKQAPAQWWVLDAAQTWQRIGEWRKNQQN